MSEKKAVIKISNMDDAMLALAISKAQYAQEHCPNEQEIASYMKNAFEAEHEPTWHCFVGRNFASYVTHEKGRYCYFYVGQMAVCLFKTP
uniref:Dynein light chain n=1 Tax=Chromera velia CCMP2878 TaxID=1169474 RepID=A0A0G4I172_9ALVE|mmetsp:Transcript_24363/g.47836  ORF Transcript_24363/g.47836 Transcript_24363/m.47836 type:complete len:90 (+) Transcript_24363:259-528(+)|eukprot:Cvel_19.t1-p1 / transcript=Cvel_19.t1 / gene=Cvel_19 / organism=Chromera_velia_CCMP2878 / gene_product=Dynein light chain LC6, flagellar outer arm, putative / transcript_product=Dynein light chain LC6, flagellar outer arm, putative / location=Cvel_scaffold5:140173-141801(-) / protein_length=89 / sequence_SO=supercontig / SO=protein_coding / is_pseudo=false